jgi:hypothetical protein
VDPVEYDIRASGYAAAFSSVRAAKNIFWIIIGVCLVLQILGFVLVEFAGLVGEPPRAVATSPEVVPEEETATQQADAESVDGEADVEPRAYVEQPVEVEGGWKTESAWYYMLYWLLPATKFLAFVLALLLVMTLMLATKLSLLGRLGGIVGFVSAFFWSLLLLALVTPWQQVLADSVAAGATFNLGEILRAAQRVDRDSIIAQIVYYARFMAFPLLALGVWLVVHLRFGGGYRQSELGTLGSVPQQRLAPRDEQHETE